jgi:S-adenosylmethionine:tRNA ribosyltransferase-isomerase
VPLSTDLFDFHLPPELIAQHPAERRDASRLLVVHRRERRWEHRVFSDLPEYLGPTDRLFRNNAAVLPARLRAQRASGGAVECLLLRPAAASTARSGIEQVWWTLLRPGRKLPIGAKFSGDSFSGEVFEKQEDGTVLVGFSTPNNEPISEVAARIGAVPLPPYILREGTEAERAEDLERYQTVYADLQKRVAAAAPTAGLHFTPELLATLSRQGVETKNITLHVGLGTFKPIATAEVESHAIHRETYELPVDTQQALFDHSKRRIAVGTTSVRSIEAFLSQHREPGAQPYFGEAGIFIYPPYPFQGVDALITNFHQPRSTLLCLVSAFLSPGRTDGIAWLQEIYADAIRLRYRFFSYGDAMLIL